MPNATDQLATLWTDVLKCTEVTEDADFFARGGSSIEAVHLAAAIQETFHVSVDAVEVVLLRKFSEIAAVVDTRLRESP